LCSAGPGLAAPGLGGGQRQLSLADARKTGEDGGAERRDGDAGVAAGGDDVAALQRPAAGGAVIGEPGEEPARMAGGVAADRLLPLGVVDREADRTRQ